jgi:glycosyltransferase involved in cell wall biosynthesis
VVALRNPSAYFLRWRLGFGNWCRNMALGEMARLSAWRADRVIFVSDQSRRAISRRLPIPLTKTEVVYHGISPSFTPAVRHGQGAPSPSITRPYILSVSQIRRAKNYPRLVEAFVARAEKDLRGFDLVILGAMEDRWTERRISETLARTGLGSRVHLPGPVGRAALPAWYAGASLFVLPSLLETFGHPLVEAMASGLPVVASETTSNPEIVGDAGLYFDPWSVQAIGDALSAVLGDEGRARSMSERSLRRAADFSWEKTAAQTRRVLEKAVGRGAADPPE